MPNLNNLSFSASSSGAQIQANTVPLVIYSKRNPRIAPPGFGNTRLRLRRETFEGTCIQQPSPELRLLCNLIAGEKSITVEQWFCSPCLSVMNFETRDKIGRQLHT